MASVPPQTLPSVSVLSCYDLLQWPFEALCWGCLIKFLLPLWAISVQRLLANQGSPITWEPSTPNHLLDSKGGWEEPKHHLPIDCGSLSLTKPTKLSRQSEENDPLLSPAFPGYWSWAALLFWNILLLFLQACLHSPSPMVHMSLGRFSGSRCSVTEGQVTIKLSSRSSCFLGRKVILLRWRQAYF